MSEPVAKSTDTSTVVETPKNFAVLMKAYPKGMPDADRDFQLGEVDEPKELESNEVLVSLVSLSMDPFLRGRMAENTKSYIGNFQLGKPIDGFGVGRVIQSKNKQYKVGSYITGMMPWQHRFVMDPSKSSFNHRIDRTLSEDPKEPATNLVNWLKTMKTMNQLPGVSGLVKWVSKGSSSTPQNNVPEMIANSFPLTYHTSVLGMPGLTAWLGFVKLCQPKEGETLFVSAASGAVGQIVGQLGKLRGLRVVGSAGSDAKCKFLKTELDFDDAINYKTCGDIQKAISASCPKGIDCYFDNVGGETLDAVLEAANVGARIAICGAISQYNGEQYRLKNAVHILVKSLRVTGFIVDRMVSEFGTSEALYELTEGLATGKFKYTEDVTEGKLSDAPACYVRMLKGENFGKAQLKLC